jgi:hypothetical protein
MKGSTQVSIERFVLSIIAFVLFMFWMNFLIEWQKEFDITDWIKVPVVLIVFVVPWMVAADIFTKYWFPHIDRLEAKDKKDD